jgi:hypothetical protein
LGGWWVNEVKLVWFRNCCVPTYGVVIFLKSKGVVRLKLVEHAGPLELGEVRELRRVLEESPREAEARRHDGFVANLGKAFVENALLKVELQFEILGGQSGLGACGNSRGLARRVSALTERLRHCCLDLLMRFVLISMSAPLQTGVWRVSRRNPEPK